MALKKKTKKKTQTKSVKAASRKGRRGGSVAGLGPRKCGVCGKRGHNKRSHEPGGRLYETSGINPHGRRR